MLRSAVEMLQSKLPEVASCLVLDIRLPGLSGLDFKRSWRRRMFTFRLSS